MNHIVHEPKCCLFVDLEYTLEGNTDNVQYKG